MGTRAWPVVLVALFALALAACGGGGGDDDDGGDSGGDPDPLAVLAAMFEEPPPGLPDGIELEDQYADESFYLDHLVAAFSMRLGGGREHYVYIQLYSDPDAAEEEFDLLSEDSDTSDSRTGVRCFLATLPFYVDEDEADLCYARTGLMIIEVESPVGDEGEYASEVARALQRHVESLEEAETKRLRELPPAPLAAVLATIPPPDAPDGTPANNIAFLEDVPDGAIDEVTWVVSDEWMLIYTIFEDDEAAEDFRDDGLDDGELDSDKKTACGEGRDPGVTCIRAVGPVAISAVRDSTSASKPLTPRSIDKDAVEWLDDVEEQTQLLLDGELPDVPARAATATATATRTGEASTPTRTPTRATATATRPPATATPTRSNLNRIATGSWTFTLTTSLSTCSDQLPVGERFTVKFEFDDTDGDTYINIGETFSILQVIPGEYYIGTRRLTLPNVEFSWPLAIGGTAYINLHYTEEDYASQIHYVETYNDGCKFEGEFIG
ncbi:MAG: hypothetical protein IT303_10665 [Dehalococcoidia bacterium]|nr:hypothetical protein [Dehalococcoidia bacterium]